MANENQFKLKTKYIAPRGVAEYRDTIKEFVKPSDFIFCKEKRRLRALDRSPSLEIGCEWGITSVLIHEVCKNLIATDISLECITRARSQYPEIRFETLDAFNIKDAMKFSDRFSKNCVVWKYGVS